MTNHPANHSRQTRIHGPLLKKEGSEKISLIKLIFTIVIFPFALLDGLLAAILILLIKIYQKTLSPDHGLVKVFFPYGACKFHPTCSYYGIDALKKYGFFRGVPKLSWRVLRCNPWSQGGYDPVE